MRGGSTCPLHLLPSLFIVISVVMSALSSRGEAMFRASHSCVCKATACGEVCLDAIATHSPCRTWSRQPAGCSRSRSCLNHRLDNLDYGSSTSTWSSCSKDTPDFDELVDGRTRSVAEVCVILNLLALPLLTLLACSADPLPPPGSIPHASSLLRALYVHLHSTHPSSSTR